jgi:phage terminase large subunit
VGEERGMDEGGVLEGLAGKRNEWLRGGGKGFLTEVLGIGVCKCRQKDGSEGCRMDVGQEKILADMCTLILVKMKGELVGYDKLEEIEKSIYGLRGVSVESAKGVGKTALAAIVGLLFLVCMNEARVVLLGPKYEQIKKNLWAEIAKWMGHSALVYGADNLIDKLLVKEAGKIYCKHVKSRAELGERWVMYILTFPKNADIGTQKIMVQGIHDRNVLFLLDEASAIPDHIQEAIEETLTDPVNLEFVIYNPNKRTGWALETQRKMRYRWICHHLSAYDSPRVEKKQIEYMIDKYGRDSNKVRVSIFGLPPIGDEGALIPWEWIQEAKERWAEMVENIDPEHDPLLVAYDIGGGGDLTIRVAVQGGAVLSPILKNNSPDTNAVYNWMLRDMAELDPDFVFVDKNGIGNKVYFDLRQLRGVKNLYGINAQNTTFDEKFSMLRDKLFWLLREDFENGSIGIPPDDEELEGELSILTYDDEQGKGKIKVISKKDAGFKKNMLSQLGYRSPGKADALSFTKYLPLKMLGIKKVSMVAKKVNRLRREEERSSRQYSWMA